MTSEQESALRNKLEQAERKAAYYQKLAQECGDRRLKEAEELSRLIGQLRANEQELARTRDELEQRVHERTAELEATNARLVREMQERQAIADELRQAHAALQHSYAALEDERRTLETRVQERTRELVQIQQERVRELATPLIPLRDDVVLMPLIGTIDRERAQQVRTTLLEGIKAHRATTAILDITGVRSIDLQVAQALVQAARGARLLGAQVILTGIQPPIARALVELGTDLRGIVTHSSLPAGIADALRAQH